MNCRSGPRVVCVAALALAFSASSLTAQEFNFSFEQNGVFNLGGNPFRDGDVVSFTSGLTGELFDEGDFLDSANTNVTASDINALHVKSNGDILFSIHGSTNSLPGESNFDNDDVILWDGVMAVKVFDGDTVFDAENENVDALYLLPNGDLILSTQGASSADGNAYGDEDLILWDGSSTSLFYAPTFSFDIDGIGYVAGDTLLFSIDGSGKVIDGQTFDSGDVISLDMSTGSATLLFEEDSGFGVSLNINGLHANDPILIPEPANAVLAVIALGGLALRRRGPWRDTTSCD